MCPKPCVFNYSELLQCLQVCEKSAEKQAFRVRGSRAQTVRIALGLRRGANCSTACLNSSDQLNSEMPGMSCSTTCLNFNDQLN